MGIARLARLACGRGNGRPSCGGLWWARRSAALLFCALAPGYCLAAPAWLNEMNRAFAELNYDGVFSYFTGRDLATLRIVHVVADGERRERLVQLNGPPWEIIRRGDEVVQVLMPDAGFKEISRGLSSGLFVRAFVHRLDRISGLYAITSLGAGRIAGRPARGIALTPKDADRFAHRLWLDEEHRLLLRSELLDGGGARLEVFQFTQIAIGDAVQPAALEPGRYEGALTVPESPPSSMSEANVRRSLDWRLGWMPAGFSTIATDQHPLPRPDGRRSVAASAMMYSDGLAAFSVFVEAVPRSTATAQISRLGATVAMREFVPGPSGQRTMVTLVGELPEATARRIARSVEFQPEER